MTTIVINLSIIIKSSKSVMSKHTLTGMDIYKYRYIVWIILFALLELSVSQSSTRRKRQYSGRRCVTPDREMGTCILLTSCPILKQLDPPKLKHLRRYFCDLTGDELRVCCPNSDGTAPSTTRPSSYVTSRPVNATLLQPVSTESTNFQDFGKNDSNVNMPSFLPKECGISRTGISGAIKPGSGTWPWIAAIYRERNGRKYFECSGTLVTDQHVITSAKCAMGSREPEYMIKPWQVRVRLGDHDQYSNYDSMYSKGEDVHSVTIHESFNSWNNENDIAVLKLDRPVQFNDTIAPICLPYDSFNDEDLTGKIAFSVRWEATFYAGIPTKVLREDSYKIQNPELCQKAYENSTLIQDAHICAVKLDGYKDSCKGDAGAPLMSIGPRSRFYLVGINSFEYKCLTPTFPGLFTRVTKFLDWLRPLLTS